ncbi:MAG: hypothetical protein D3914_17955, partial [Candidatus Electrothrix sp. LOE2]|nr:hypothetical protein [Candidatus Electrothrix sp. LOE2]
MTSKGAYRCSWYQHRSRKRADGSLQPPKRELSCLNTAEKNILASKANEVARLVEEYTGMDFKRFTRSMLLAQGGFAAFLRASEDDRADILEQITGSEIYTEISKRVHSRFTEAKKAQEKLKEKTGAMQLLSSARSTEIQQELIQEQEEEIRLGKAVDEKAAALDWLDKIKALRTALVQIKEEHEKLAQEESAFAEDAARLKTAQNALILVEDYAQLIATRKQQDEEGAALTLLQHKLPDRKGLLSQAEERLSTAQTQLDQCRINREQGHVLIKQVRELDLRIREKDQAIRKEEAVCHDLRQKNAAAQKQGEQLEQELALARNRQEQSRAYLAEHKVDEQLISDL